VGTLCTMRTYGWRSWGEAFREIAIAAVLAMFVLVIEEAGGKGYMPSVRSFLRNAILGAAIVTGARFLETILSWAVEQSRIPTTFRVILYAVGGWIGYFAGAVISGLLIGFQKRDFDPHSFHFTYAAVVTAAITILLGLVFHHNRKRNDRLRASIERLKEHEFAEKELEIARAMQQRLLPPMHIEHDGWRVEARTEAAHMVGGDFYDVVRLDDGAAAVVIADVSGKGIAASLLMASCKAMIPFLASRGGAAAVMGELNEKLCAQLERREFVAMTFVRFEPASGAMEIVNAGMPDPFLLGDNGLTTLAFTGDRFPLGARRASRYQATRATLAPGERLLLFSDGLPEARRDGNPIGYDALEAMVREFTSVDALLAGVGGLEVDDDLTVVLLERLSLSS